MEKTLRSSQRLIVTNRTAGHGSRFDHELALLIFTAFVVPVEYMLPWCRWINYMNPVAYDYESLMVNEYHGRNFTCSTHIPDYANANANNVACDAVGAVPGQPYVIGDD